MRNFMESSFVSYYAKHRGPTCPSILAHIECLGATAGEGAISRAPKIVSAFY